MRRFLLLKSATLYTRHYHVLHTSKPISIKSPLLPFFSFQCNYKFFSSHNKSSSNPFNPTSKTNLSDLSSKEQGSIDDAEDVSTKEFKGMIRKYLDDDDDDGDEEMTAEIVEAILKRRLSKKHEETDDEIKDDLEDDDEWEPMEDIDSDEEIKSDFEEACETDDEIEDLYNAKEYIEKKMIKNDF